MHVYMVLLLIGEPREMKSSDKKYLIAFHGQTKVLEHALNDIYISLFEVRIIDTLGWHLHKVCI